jgi:hypothetical protein
VAITPTVKKALGKRVQLTQTTLIGLSDDFIGNNTHGDSFGEFQGVLVAKTPSAIASGNTVQLTQTTVIGLLDDVSGNKTHGDSFREFAMVCKAMEFTVFV